MPLRLSRHQDQHVCIASAAMPLALLWKRLVMHTEQQHVQQPTQAARHAPSIIFLDELDGLVPARSSNSSGGDQVFASVVSTFLALMDGVVDRGAVVVIAATNRCDGLRLV